MNNTKLRLLTLQAFLAKQTPATKCCLPGNLNEQFSGPILPTNAKGMHELVFRA